MPILSLAEPGKSIECFFIVAILWIFSLSLHEFGHAWVAYRGGDHTVADKGYLTMNPFRYLHPVQSLLLPMIFVVLGGIGLPGGAVYINRALLRSRTWDTAVSLAGPAMDLILILLLGFAFKFGLIPPDRENLFTISLAFLLRLLISALLLNMLPVPPLDGFQAIAPWLPRAPREQLLGLSNVGMFIVLLSLWFIPSVSSAFWGTVASLSSVFDVEPAWVRAGYGAFRFWGP
ncbi:MAG TPA: site-2 protease family protein [Verrucomicrobiae bacterium]|nr:site-2 protease family protein [Verrucomicrobiae bacterium]